MGDIVYRHFSGKREGFLTNTRSKLVQRDTLNKLANELGINKLILSSGHTISHNSYMGGNAFEALVGALYLDRGYDACMVFLKERILKQMINIDKVAYKEVNFKSKLIEWSQKNRIKLNFKLLEEAKDKDGSPVFSYQIILEGIEGCSGKGFSKKESQQKASKDTLNKLKKEPQFIDQVFAAKAERTKMEEQPTQAIPDTNTNQDFMVNSTTEAHTEETQEPVYTEPISTETESVDNTPHTDEFDLSDISAKEKSREEIIAAAEQAAFSDEN